MGKPILAGAASVLSSESIAKEHKKFGNPLLTTRQIGINV
jgi:hypothetical protein